MIHWPFLGKGARQGFSSLIACPQRSRNVRTLTKSHLCLSSTEHRSRYAMSLFTCLNLFVGQHPLLITSSSVAILLAIPLFKLVRLHRRLKQSTSTFCAFNGTARRFLSDSGSAQLPTCLTSNPAEYRVFYDVATKSISRSLLPS